MNVNPYEQACVLETPVYNIIQKWNSEIDKYIINNLIDVAIMLLNVYKYNIYILQLRADAS